MIYNSEKGNKKISYSLNIIALLLGLFICMSPVSAMQVERLKENNGKNYYQVTCENGMQHTIIANHAEQDFQYHYPNKGYYIKFYDMGFKSNEDFARWVCRNK